MPLSEGDIFFINVLSGAYSIRHLKLENKFELPSNCVWAHLSSLPTRNYQCSKMIEIGGASSMMGGYKF